MKALWDLISLVAVLHLIASLTWVYPNTTRYIDWQQLTIDTLTGGKR